MRKRKRTKKRVTGNNTYRRLWFVFMISHILTSERVCCPLVSTSRLVGTEHGMLTGIPLPVGLWVRVLYHKTDWVGRCTTNLV
jgi:hypothetical protein